MKLQRSEKLSVTKFTQNHTFRESLEAERALTAHVIQMPWSPDRESRV